MCGSTKNNGRSSRVCLINEHSLRSPRDKGRCHGWRPDRGRGTMAPFRFSQGGPVLPILPARRRYAPPGSRVPGRALALFLALGLPLVASPLVAGPARAEVVRVGGWFVSNEKTADGVFSHCLMVNSYLSGERRILLSVSLSGDHKALIGIADSAWLATADTPAPLRPLGPGKADVRFDDGPTRTLKTEVTAVAIRAGVPGWPSLREALRKAKQLAVDTGPSGAFRFHLYDMSEAVAALEVCADTGMPPAVKVQARDKTGKVIEEREFKPVPVPRSQDLPLIVPSTPPAVAPAAPAAR
ncbi:hypothetical protein CKO38_04710 [Rhodospirillum rubrum]|nr:hypothetical protein [Rhodospirillum rubrum]MBK1675986.1 hypothetical protein [Rhodospirillum rubrum]